MRVHLVLFWPGVSSQCTAQPHYSSWDMASDPDLRRKLVIVGDGACGKTSLLCVFVIGYFPQSYHPTIFDDHQIPCRVDGQLINLRLWDTAGQEEFDGLRPLIYSKADIVLVSFAVDNPDSLQSAVEKWLPEAHAKAPGANIFLVGLKTDLRTNEECLEFMLEQGLHCVTPDEGERAATNCGVKYLECSALTGEGVIPVFEKAVRSSLSAAKKENSSCCVIL